MPLQISRRNFSISGLAAGAAVLGLKPQAFAAGSSSAIHRFDQTQPFPVNAYIVEGEEGLVVIDATLTVSSSQKLRGKADALGKPIKAVLLTHPHPDHYAGLGVLTKGLDIPIIAQAGVDDVVRRDDAVKDKFIGPMFGAEWPTDRVFPNQRITDGAKLDFGKGLQFTAVDIGPAESLHDSMFILDGDTTAAFVGDLAYNMMHSYMADLQNDAWRRALSRLQSELPERMMMYVGHGAPTSTAMIAWQQKYIDIFETAVKVADWSDAKAASGAVTKAMKDYLPNDDLLFLMQLSIEPTAKKLGVLK